MLRFCGKGLLEQSEGITIVMAKTKLKFDDQIWKNGRDYFRQNIYYDNIKLPMIPIADASGKAICYGWQDHEANRELRMLRELEKNRNARQFNDLYPDVKKVIIYGCNELAFRFAKYLEGLKLSVAVKGKYWNYFGYKSIEDVDFDDNSQMIIYAERILEDKRSLFQRVVRSASTEFECINRIYEENILVGNITDAGGEVDFFFNKLDGKDVVILGTDAKAQDMYDLLLAHGIDIKCFAVDGMPANRSCLLLGKQIKTIAEMLADEKRLVFVEPRNKNSAWGNSYVELFDYYGYERNESFFLVRDYTDIPFSNLIHVLKGKRVILAGNERFCKILSDYLTDIEKEDIKLEYVEALQSGTVDKTDILCEVGCETGFGYRLEPSVETPRIWERYTGPVSYTDYFLMPSVFVHIDQYRLKNDKKYTVKQLIPKGILLNLTFYNSGNIFFKGLLDGHPNILSIQHNVFAYNLFSYCIRLSLEKAEDIPNILQKLLKEEVSESEFQASFPDWNKFHRSLEQHLSLRKMFTSQELFVIFHIAYMEMMTNRKVENLSQKIIYFDPHHFRIYGRAFLAKWLESDNINVQMITIHRDDITNICSIYRRKVLEEGKMKWAQQIIWWMINEKVDLGIGQADLQYSKRFEVRFEDLKLHPRKELTKICERMDIPWSDMLMSTTSWGKTSSMGEIRNFDLKPVFDRHEGNWSEFDRFRLYLICSPYQKRCGYPYENCMRFSRTQLWELFLKEFHFQEILEFETAEDRAAYYLLAYELIRWQLYENRKHMIMDDIKQEFEPIMIGKTKEELQIAKQERRQKNRYDLIKIISEKRRIVLYGLGRDGKALWDCLDETVRSDLVLCDKKAESERYYFQGKQVISPLDLCTKYMDYDIIVTSSGCFREIRADLEDMGICADRVICNTIQLWEGDDKL